MTRHLGYLSGAPRVSTRENNDSAAPRSHVLGTLGAFRQLGWQISTYIYGDLIDSGSGGMSVLRHLFKTSWFGRALGDLARFALAIKNSRAALAAISDNVDFVYERFAVLQALGRTFQKRGIPWVLETQGLFYHEAKHDRNALSLVWLAKHVEISAYRQCDVLVVVSERLKEIIVKETGARADKIIVVPNGVDLNRFNPDDYAVPNNDVPVLGFVGSLIKWQGVDRLLRATAAAHAQGAKFRLLLIGDGDERQNLEDLTRSLNLQQSVSFTGQVDGKNVPRLLAGIDAGFSGQLPSGLGGMYHSPLKIYEYMAMGKAVIASDFADARSVIADTNAGFLFDPTREETLVAALLSAFGDRDNLRRMGDKARQEIIAHHSWAARTMTMIQDIDQRIGNK